MCYETCCSFQAHEILWCTVICDMNPRLCSFLHRSMFHTTKQNMATDNAEESFLLETQIKKPVKFLLSWNRIATFLTSCKMHLAFQYNFRLSNVQYFLKRMATLNGRNMTVKYTLYLFQPACWQWQVLNGCQHPCQHGDSFDIKVTSSVLMLHSSIGSSIRLRPISECQRLCCSAGMSPALSGLGQASPVIWTCHTSSAASLWEMNG